MGGCLSVRTGSPPNDPARTHHRILPRKAPAAERTEKSWASAIDDRRADALGNLSIFATRSSDSWKVNTRTSATCPIDVTDASPFHRAAWQACRTIPAGETRPYRWLASAAGRPNAPRAAGQAMARNRLPFLIPCHRVIASDGSLGGYGSGRTRLELKKRLLEMEARSRALT